MAARIYLWLGVALLLATTILVVTLAAAELHRRAQHDVLDVPESSPMTWGAS